MSAALINLERWQEAIAVLRRQIEIVDANFGSDSLQRAQPLYNLGLCEQALGDRKAAESSFRASLAAIDKHSSADDPSRAFPLIRLAYVLLETGRTDEALAPAEQALALLADGNAKLQADARAALAKVLWVSGRDRARAVSLADEAARSYRALGPEAERALADLESWRGR